MSDKNGTGERRNMLSFEKMHLLALAIKEHRDHFDTQRLTVEEAAQFLSQALGFRVTVGNVSGVRRSLNISWGTPKRRRNASEFSDPDVDVVGCFYYVHDVLEAYGKALAQLYTRAGQTFVNRPDSLHMLKEELDRATEDVK